LLEAVIVLLGLMAGKGSLPGVQAGIAWFFLAFANIVGPAFRRRRSRPAS